MKLKCHYLLLIGMLIMIIVWRNVCLLGNMCDEGGIIAAQENEIDKYRYTWAGRT
jgi:hypothetical protein